MSEPSSEPTRLSAPPTTNLEGDVEDIRAEEYPAVPAELLAAVLSAEQAHLDDRTAATRAVGRAIDAWLVDNQPTSTTPPDSADPTIAATKEGDHS